MKIPKLPTRYEISDHITLYGKALVVTFSEHFDDAEWAEIRANDRTVVDVVARDDRREYFRQCYFVPHKNLWRSRWMRREK